MARLLIVNADDFGLTDGINEGIIRAHEHGIVTSTSLMVLARAAAAAVSLARTHPRLSVGLHFVEPPDVNIDDEGTLAGELHRQLTRFAQLMGRPPTHLDSHHHVHLEGDRLRTFASAAEWLGIPLRSAGTVNYIGGFYGQWEWGITDLSHITVQYLTHLLAEEVREGVNEIACHPAAWVHDLESGYREERLIELRTLTTPQIPRAIRHLTIRLRGFADCRR